MKYLLVLQTDADFEERTESVVPLMPLGLPYINGAMRSAGFDVDAINLQYSSNPEKDLREAVAGRDAVLCGGLSTEYSHIKWVFDIARSVNPDIITIGGGGGFTSEPIIFSELTEVDYAVIGEGEITNCELAYALDHGLETEKILGLVIRRGANYHFTGERPYNRDVDSIPFPSFEGLDIEKYLDGQRVDYWYYGFAYFSDTPRIMPMVLSRSCPFNCKFCYHPIGRGYRQRSLDSFFKELDQWIKKYQINCVSLVDECFSIQPKRVLEFCERIKPYNIAWMCQMRVETYTEELIKKMVESGCVSAYFGLESMSQSVLMDMNKKQTVEQVKYALEIGYQNAANVQGNILFGSEVESEQTIREMVEWADANRKYHINNYGLIGVYPGSGYYDNAIKRGLIKDKKSFIADGCPLINITNLPDKKYTLLKFFAFLKNLELKNIGEVIKFTKSENGYEAMCKCSHCGYVNNYKNISPERRKQGIIRSLACRNCHNFCDYIIEENVNTMKEHFNTTRWVFDTLVGNKNESISRYIANNSIHNVAVYGLYYASCLIDELNLLGVEVSFGIDRKPDAYKDLAINVYGIERTLPKVDIIIVIPFYHIDEIESDLSPITSDCIITLEDMLSEV